MPYISNEWVDTAPALEELNRIRDAVHETAVSKGWWPAPNGGEANFPEKAMMVVTEIAEAVEDWRAGKNPAQHAYERTLPVGEDGSEELSWQRVGVTDKPVGIPSELADAIIRILDVCGYYKIDIARAVSEKMEFNITRPYRHGGKRA